MHVSLLKFTSSRCGLVLETRVFGVALLCSVLVPVSAWAFVRPLTPPEPNSSDAVLVSKTEYDAAGRVRDTVDNAGLMVRREYDAAGRVTATIENYVDGTPGGASAAGFTHDEDRVTRYVYNPGDQVVEQTADLPSGSDDQTTQYVYAAQLSDKGSPVANNAALRATIYPDSSETVSSQQLTGSDLIEVTYLANGQTATRTDPRGTELTYTYDDAGRLTRQAVTTVGSDTDDSVRAITTEYDGLGRSERMASHGDAAATGSSVLNEVVHTYDGLGNLLSQEQDHDPATSGSKPTVSYAYDTSVSGNVFTHATRLTATTYPNGRAITTTYTGHTGIDDAISRATGLEDAATSSTGGIVAYDHTGSGQMVAKRLPQANLRLNHVDLAGEGISADDPYDASMDRFGRSLRHRWERYDFATSTRGSDLYHFSHAYDRASNKLYDKRHIYGNDSVLYLHDALHRMTAADRGVLNPAGDGLSDYTFTQDWTLDPLGNWSAYHRDGSLATGGADTGASANPSAPSTDWDLQETRTHNDANEITALTTAGSGTSPASGPFQQDAGSDGLLVFEAEHYTQTISRSGYTWDQQSTGVSAGQYMRCAASSYQTFDKHKLTYTVTIPSGQGGTYRVWARVRTLETPTASHDSLYLRLGTSGSLVKWDGIAISSAWQWARATDSDNSGAVVELSLTAGTHTLIVGQRDVKVDLDALYLTKDGDTPSGFNPDPTTTGSFGNGVFLEAEAGTPNNTQWSAANETAKEDVMAGWPDDDASPVTNSNFLTTAPELIYDAAFVKTGRHYLWVRSSWTAADWNNQFHGGLNGAGPTSARQIKSGLGHTFFFSDTMFGLGIPPEVAYLDVPSSGVHSVHLWMMDDGALVDRVVLTTNASYDPNSVNDPGNGAGIGPPASPRAPGSGGSGGGGTTLNPAYDAAGNLKQGPDPRNPGSPGSVTSGGTHSYVYDAWNRLVEVTDDALDSGAGLLIARYEYDGLSRRIVRTLSNSGDLNATYHDYYDGQRVVETRSGSVGSGLVIRHQVWGLQYIDELVQVTVNQELLDDPGMDAADPDHDVQVAYALHDPLYSLLALVEEGTAGALLVRHEYDPYGTRQTFVATDGADTTLTLAVDDAPRVTSGGVEQPYALTDAGHQGLMHCENTGLIYNRARYRDGARFINRDPLGYPDGMNGYASWHVLLGKFDPSGSQATQPATQPSAATLKLKPVVDGGKHVLKKAAIDVGFSFDATTGALEVSSVNLGAHDYPGSLKSWNVEIDDAQIAVGTVELGGEFIRVVDVIRKERGGAAIALMLQAKTSAAGCPEGCAKIYYRFVTRQGVFARATARVLILDTELNCQIEREAPVTGNWERSDRAFGPVAATSQCLPISKEVRKSTRVWSYVGEQAKIDIELGDKVSLGEPNAIVGYTPPLAEK